MCDENLKIMNCNPRFPGSSHDSFIWRQSNISGIMENVYRQADETFFLVGDSGKYEVPLNVLKNLSHSVTFSLKKKIPLFIKYEITN